VARVAFGDRRALNCLDADHPEIALFRERFERAAFVAGLRGPGEDF
jgi:hypothetical protein